MKTWFQSGPTKAAPEVNDDLKLDADGDVPPAPPRPQSTRPDPQPKPPAAPQSSDYEDEDDDNMPSLPPAAIAAMAAQRKSAKIDPDALGVIREEVVREQSARKSEADPIETQIDLGIDDTETKDRAAAARNRMGANATGVVEDIEEFDEDLEAALADEDNFSPEPAAKSDRLPDIEEINSTLSDAPDYDDLDDDIEMTPTHHPKTRSRRGFRLGFGLMLLVAAALVGLYVYAPAISNSVPAMTGFLEGYVNTMDGIRRWLDGSTQDMVDQITKLLGTVS